jgi:hypothetical protein
MQTSTRLYKAARAGDIKQARMLPARGANVNVRRDNGETPLHEAVNCKHIEIVRLLVSHGADVSGKRSLWRLPMVFRSTWEPAARRDITKVIFDMDNRTVVQVNRR